MSNIKDINSTERLLNVIRGTQKPEPVSEDASRVVSETQKPSNKLTLNFPKTLTGKNRFSVGVDIGVDAIYLAKATKASDGKPLLVDQKIVKFVNQPPMSPEKFKELLKNAISSFAGSVDQCDLWTTINPSDVNVQHIKVPRVPKKQLENVIYWTAKKENPFDDKEFVFDFEMQGEVIDQGIPKYSVMVYSAPRAEVERVRQMFSSADIDLAGITIAPFAVQNIFRTKWIDVPESTFASLYIGSDFSRIDIYSKNNLVLTRGIKTGISSMIEVINESISETEPHEAAKRQEIKTQLMNVLFNPEKMSFEGHEIDWVENGIFDVISPVLERLTRQIERTLEYYTSSVGYEKVDKLYISSTMNVFYQPFLSYISEQLAIKTEFFDPFQGNNVNLSGASLPLAQRAALIPVIGLALSDSRHTPNVIFTYVEKNADASRSRINRVIFATFGLVLLICIVIVAFQGIEAKQLMTKRDHLEKQLSMFKPLLEKETIANLTQELKLQRQKNHQYAQRYRGIALIGELTSLTPDHIKFIRVNMSPSEIVAQGQSKSETLTIDGVVQGDRHSLDTLLAQYVMKLENSPLLQGVVLEKSNIVTLRKKEIIHFTLKAKIG